MIRIGLVGLVTIHTFIWLILQNVTFLHCAQLKHEMITKAINLYRLRSFQVEGPVLLSLLFIITGKSTAMFSSPGFGPTNFTKSYEKVQLLLGKASLLL